METLKISMAAARVNAELTQEDMAKRMQVSKSTIVSWEKGKVVPKPAQFLMYCNLCKIPSDNIILPQKLT